VAGATELLVCRGCATPVGRRLRLLRLLVGWLLVLMGGGVVKAVSGMVIGLAGCWLVFMGVGLVKAFNVMLTGKCFRNCSGNFFQQPNRGGCASGDPHLVAGPEPFGLHLPGILNEVGAGVDPPANIKKMPGIR